MSNNAIFLTFRLKTVQPLFRIVNFIIKIKELKPYRTDNYVEDKGPHLGGPLLNFNISCRCGKIPLKEMFKGQIYSSFWADEPASINDVFFIKDIIGS